MPDCYRISKKLLKFSFNLPAQQDMSRICRLTEMAIHFIDAVADVKISVAARVAANNMRAVVAEREFKSTLYERQEVSTERCQQSIKVDFL